MRTMRVMTWNVWWRFGDNWREREPGLLRVLADVAPDIVGIQECWGEESRSQADLFAETIGGRAAYVDGDLPPATPAGDGAVMGVGLASRWPIIAVERADLPSEGRRNPALVATLDAPWGETRVVVGAVSWEPERMAETTAQVAALQRLVHDGSDARPGPGVLLADLNYDNTQPPLATMRLHDAWDAAAPGADPRTLSETNRFAPPECDLQWNRRIDHIRFAPGTAGARALRAWIVRDEPGGMPPSDHYPVVADIAVG
jgi:endonuclease/exonuclease/phosphatase family metal-dependent hydrolase